MKLAVLFSGGKDSAYALYKARQEHDVVCLISIISENKDSYMFHTPNIDLTQLQAQSLGLPLIKKVTKGIKEEELEDLKAAIMQAKEEYSVKGIVSGAFASAYQRDRIEKICNELNLECISPLWGKNPEKLMREMLKKGFKFLISSIAADGLDETWLGRVITDQDIDKLVELNKKIGIHIAFEGGEAETLMIQGPIFKKKIIIKKAEKIMEDKNTGMYRITKAELE